jgi:hypothetical protein
MEGYFAFAELINEDKSFKLLLLMLKFSNDGILGKFSIEEIILFSKIRYCNLGKDIPILKSLY